LNFKLQEWNSQNIVHFFEEISYADFELKNPVKLGFYFIDKNKDKLLNLFESMVELGYSLEELYETEEGKWQICISIIDVLDLDKLKNRNIVFEKFQTYGLACKYEGFSLI
jgi:hypothetical protein